jgi:hypothetical protein
VGSYFLESPRLVEISTHPDIGFGEYPRGSTFLLKSPLNGFCSDRRQDDEHARWDLVRRFPRLLSANPKTRMPRPVQPTNPENRLARMRIELEHVFFCTAPGASGAKKFVRFGSREGPPNRHPVKSAASRRFAYANAMIELVWVDDAEEAQSECSEADSGSRCAGTALFYWLSCRDESYSIGFFRSTIWISICPDQPQFGQSTIPVVTAIRSMSSSFKACPHRGHLCTLSHCFRSLVFGSCFAITFHLELPKIRDAFLDTAKW